MERTTFSLLFYIRRDKLNKRGEAPVFMRLTINGERADASIKRFIEPHAWNSEKGKANEKCRGGKDLNLYLDAISANILQIQRDFELDKKEVSAQIILNRYLGKDQSDRFLMDASYLNLQNINFGYTLPSKITQKFGVDRVRIYLACENVYYWSKRQGFDPRYSYSGATSQATYSPVRTISGGINIQF